MNNEKLTSKQEKRVITVEVTTIKDDEVQQLHDRIDILSKEIFSLKQEFAFVGFFSSRSLCNMYWALIILHSSLMFLFNWLRVDLSSFSLSIVFLRGFLC
ncbi:hypothetical protein [Limosilactobacillus equigenerosi]|uniref:hypothetical protein n=1 Tax=Limosilactobacillus equigenerosi TaxID=417373 RepID=UPI000AF8148F|nr:hypothetical protein [Limosilactobacillus equigenerosi]